MYLSTSFVDLWILTDRVGGFQYHVTPPRSLEALRPGPEKTRIEIRLRAMVRQFERGEETGLDRSLLMVTFDTGMPPKSIPCPAAFLTLGHPPTLQPDGTSGFLPTGFHIPLRL